MFRDQKDSSLKSGSEGLLADELALSARPSDEGIHQIEFVLSGLATAMVTGNICLIDEIGKLKPRTLAMLAPVGDHRRTLYSSLAGVSIPAHPQFRLICTSNTSDFTTSALPEFMVERLSVKIHVDMLPRKTLDLIIQERFSRAGHSAEMFLKCFWEQWLKRYPDQLPSPRQLIQICQLSFSIAALQNRALTERDVEEAIHYANH